MHIETVLGFRSETHRAIHHLANLEHAASLLLEVLETPSVGGRVRELTASGIVRPDVVSQLRGELEALDGLERAAPLRPPMLDALGQLVGEALELARYVARAEGDKHRVDEIAGVLRGIDRTTAAPGSPEPNGSGGVQTRARERRELEVRVDISSESTFFTGLTENISEGGLFVASWTRLPLGTSIHLRIDVDGTEVCIDGAVRWHREQSDAHGPGMGIAFLEPPVASDLALLDEFFSERPPLYYEV